MKQSDTKNLDNIRLPYNIEAEKATLAALITEKNAIYDVVDFLKPEMFYDSFHKQVYEAILKLENTSGIDLVTVVEEVSKGGDGKAAYKIADLSDMVGSATHVAVHAMVVYQYWLRRNLITKCYETVLLSQNMTEDVTELISNHAENIDNIANSTIESETKPISKVALQAYNNYSEREKKSQEGKTIYVSTGVRTIDEYVRLKGGDLVILAARPAMGKTAFMLNIARKTAKIGNNVLIFSLEMTDVSLVDRLVIAESGIDPESYKTGRLIPQEFESMYDGQNNISMLPVMINDRPLMTVQQIKAQAKKQKRDGKCDIVLIDYLQLIEMPSKQNRDTEVSATTRALKIAAKELNVPIIVLSQLNRNVENRASKIPMLADLRESGAIEQDADIVMFIHREAYYSDNADRNEATIRIAKNREGKTGDITIWVNDTITDFRDKTTFPSIANNHTTPF